MAVAGSSREMKASDSPKDSAKTIGVPQASWARMKARTVSTIWSMVYFTMVSFSAARVVPV